MVGGGPAGLEAARIAALRGHEVILYERTAALGGQVLVAARAPLRPGYGESITWLVRQLRKTTATVRLGTEATVERVLADRPDAVIVATGAVPRRPDVPGADLPGRRHGGGRPLGRGDRRARGSWSSTGPAGSRRASPPTTSPSRAGRSPS